MNGRLKHIISLIFGLPIYAALALSGLFLIIKLEGAWRTALIIVLLAISIAILIFLGVRSSKTAKLVESLLNILYKEVNPDKFIAESENAIAKTKNKALRNTLSLNLAVGYAAAGRYDDAIHLMKEMNILSADKTSKAMFYLNAASFYAEKGAPTEAAEAYSLGKPFYEKATKDIPFSHIRLTRGLIHYAEGEYKEALEALENARKKGFEDRHTLTKLQLFEARCNVQLGNIKEARAIYSKVIQKNTYPFFLSSAKAELEALNA